MTESYELTLGGYIVLLGEKHEAGAIDEDTCEKLADKVAEWHVVAQERGLIT